MMAQARDPNLNSEFQVNEDTERRLEMKRRFFPYGGLTAAVVVAAGLMMTGTVEAQNYPSGTSSISTPRMSDGKPDLSGLWQDRAVAVRNQVGNRAVPVTITKDEVGNGTLRFGSRRCDPTQKGTEGKGCFEETNETADLEFTFRTDPNRPVYKPEYWDKVQDLDYNTNTKDPQFTCMPLGLPRMGPPRQIVQTAKYVILFYGGYPSNQFRIVPIDGRGHDPVRAKDISYFGDPVGRWDGETLVVESVGFNDETWIASGSVGGGGGYFHSYDMKVTERLRREGNVIHYQATVDDPTVLLQPWALTAKELDLDRDPNAYLQEGDQCSQPDPGLFTGKIRH
jgi:hypothetical protein